MNNIAGFFILSGVILTFLVYIDTRRYRQPMRIMGIVWPLTMLWSSWVGLVAYLWFGRAKSKMGSMDMSKESNMDSNMDMSKMKMDGSKPKWQGVALSALHCGAGCTLADIIGESISGGMALSIYTGWILDFILALAIGVYFQYMAIQQMGRIKTRAAIGRALKIDFLSLTAWQVGMYGFMAIYIFCFGGAVNRLSFEFWFVMQFAMLAGFMLSYPMNIFLIRIGLKKAM